MGRAPAPIPDIFSLTLLMRLLGIKNGLRDPGFGDEKVYLDKIGMLLRDSLLPGVSQNQVLKLTGRPYHKELEEAEGIEVKTLDKLAEAILKYTPGMLPTPETLRKTGFSWWRYFVENIARPTSEVLGVNKFRYYKYLPPTEKNLVETLIRIRVSELGLDPDSVTYIVYFFNKQTSNVHPAILQLNRRTLTISYNYYRKNNDEWSPGVTFRSNGSEGEFLLAPNICYINLVERDITGNYRRMSIYLQTPQDNDFYATKRFKGFSIVSSSMGAVAVAFEIVMDKMDSFNEAYEIVKDNSKIPAEVNFELMRRRFESNNVNINATNKLRTERTFGLVKDIEGCYVVGYIANPGTGRGGLLTIAIASFRLDGMVAIKMAHHKNPIMGFVENEHDQGSDIIRVNPFDEGIDVAVKLHYYLKAVYEYPEGTIDYLWGRTLGIREGVITGADFIFIKAPERNFEELEKRIKIKSLPLNSELHTEEENRIKKYFRDLSVDQAAILNKIVDSFTAPTDKPSSETPIEPPK